MENIEGFSAGEAPPPRRPEPPPPGEAHGAAAVCGLDARAVLRSLGAVVYDWDIASDGLSWGANVGETEIGRASCRERV